jgi:polyphosphate:AMP phosphotransferase
MFEAAELGQTVDKATYEREAARLREELLAAQQDLRRADFPVIVVIGGVDGAGKGETVNTLLEWMDPRFIETFALGPPTDEERERPRYWRFWRALPPRSKLGIFFGGWHSAPIVDRAYKRIKNAELDRQLAAVNAFERLLVDDGALLIKFWMHLSRDRQRKRLAALAKDRRTRWRVTDADWEHFGMYDRFARISAHALRRTSTGDAPWTIVEGFDRRYQTLTVGRHLLGRLQAHLAARAARAAAPVAAAPPVVTAAGERPVTILSAVDLTRSLDEASYRRRLEECQGALNLIARRAARARRSVVVVYEGVDAAGKGGNIRRVTSALDARMYRIVPIAAPNEEERQHPYLWRFWRQLPRGGQMTIFDRSWYGRVLVERVEGFCTPAAWMRAYAEINDFEEQLVEHGIVVAKFWMQIGKDEQLRRFEDRAATGFKRFKITDEDWRNRERWDAYEQAVNDMIERTSTEHAPWTLVATNCKRLARIQTLETLHQAIARAL